MSDAINQAARNRTAFIAGAAALGMVGLAYASVPLYRVFCQVTGFGGTTQVVAADAAPVAPVAGTMMRVRFDGNTRDGIPWKFAPTTPYVDLPIGERRIAYFHARNDSDAPVTGVATYNVSPESAGKYFMKVQCFCFNEQTLGPGEAVDMPVIYYVDPAILDDPDARKIEEITLSYSFYPVEQPVQAPAIRATSSASLQAKSQPNR